jgi:hypothetical protein
LDNIRYFALQPKSLAKERAVRQAGGWTSMATVQKHVDETEIANAGIAGDD